MGEGPPEDLCTHYDVDALDGSSLPVLDFEFGGLDYELASGVGVADRSVRLHLSFGGS